MGKPGCQLPGPGGIVGAGVGRDVGREVAPAVAVGLAGLVVAVLVGLAGGLPVVGGEPVGPIVGEPLGLPGRPPTATVDALGDGSGIGPDGTAAGGRSDQASVKAKAATTTRPSRTGGTIGWRGLTPGTIAAVRPQPQGARGST